MHLTILAEKDGTPLIEEAKKGARIAVKLLETAAKYKGILKKRVSEITCIDDLPKVIKEAIMACKLIEDESSETLTPLAAISGSISDIVADALWEKTDATRVIVDNGGDIAIRLESGHAVNIGIAAQGNINCKVVITHRSGVGGVATSGLGGMGFTKGIASAATVFATSASIADAASTVVGNSTFFEGVKAIRCPACAVDPDSDLGNQLITLKVNHLSEEESLKAIGNGLSMVKKLMKTEKLKGAIIIVGNNIGKIIPNGVYEVT